jgi:hypothetical protein
VWRGHSCPRLTLDARRCTCARNSDLTTEQQPPKGRHRIAQHIRLRSGRAVSAGSSPVHDEREGRQPEANRDRSDHHKKIPLKRLGRGTRRRSTKDCWLIPNKCEGFTFDEPRDPEGDDCNRLKPEDWLVQTNLRIQRMVDFVQEIVCTYESDADEHRPTADFVTTISPQFLWSSIGSIGFCEQQQAGQRQHEKQESGTGPVQPTPIHDPAMLDLMNVHREQSHAEREDARQPSRELIPLVVATTGSHKETNHPKTPSEPRHHAGKVVSAD